MTWRSSLRRWSVGLTSLVVVASVAAPLRAEPSGSPAVDKSVAHVWIEHMLHAIELNPPAPTATTWRMYVVAASMYDAFAAYDPTALATRFGSELRRPPRERTDANRDEAVSYAAHRALTYVYPAQAAMFDGALEALGYPLAGTTDPTSPAAIGRRCADAVREHRLADGSNAAGGFAQIVSEAFPELYVPVNGPVDGDPTAPGGAAFDPNRWQPLRVATGTLVDGAGNPIYDPDDPASFVDQRFLTPHWGAVEPFALTSGDQFRPPPPPQAGSDASYVDALGNTSTNDAAYHSQMGEVLAYSAGLTDEHKVIAEFWADGPHTWTPPGHWNQLALGLSLRDRHDLADDVRMFFALNGALLDAGIAAWDAKRAYDFVRPQSAIRHFYAGQQVEAWGGPDQGTQTIDGSTWRPYQSLTFVTPPFAEYVSGHSTFSRAARETLLAYTGTDAFYDGTTRLTADYDGDGEEDLLGRHIAEPGALMFESGPAERVVLTWDTLLEAADEAGISRLYGGIHFQDGDRRARAMGAAIGQQSARRAGAYWAPWSHLREVVDELKASGDLTHAGFARSTTALLRAGEGLAASGHEHAACVALHVMDSQADRRLGRGLTEPGHARLVEELDFVAGLLCR